MRLLGISTFLAILFSSTQIFAQSNYVGVETCQTCHEAESAKYKKTKHANIPKTASTRQDSAVGCETCHGPGKAHVDAVSSGVGDAAKLIFSFKANPKQNAEKCIQCHQSKLDQRAFSHSPHLQRGVACSSCHTMHQTEKIKNIKLVTAGSARTEPALVVRVSDDKRWLDNKLLKEPQPKLCFSCHTNIQSQFSLPTHHRVPEGIMKCTDCHNTHGTSNRATLRQTGWETCVKCHTEKRGPFTFEHSAVKVEGCVACHTPHGSVNQNLLVRRESRFLCLQCHVNPSAVNVPHGRLGFQTRGECVRCHVSIHGSNFSPFFIQ